MSNPYGPSSPIPPSAPPNRPDARPLRKRKRVWASGAGLLLLGGMFGAAGENPDTANAAARPRATVTATRSVTAAPEPAVTVTKTAKAKPGPTVTVTKTSRPASSTSDDSASTTSGGGSSASKTGTCSITSNSGNCYQAGQYCRNIDHGATTTNASGTSITCRYRSGAWRWSY
ncbi:hypothetical protein [Streptomyces sp. NPDC005301]|uniref:hypothetical protein n=1 Tax=unclassified Streptomyces TaxID=2593676 RepID=UPI0033BAFF61